MSKYRFREYDALGLRKRIPGDQIPSAHHISKRKLKQKDVEVVFDVKDYKEYVTGFRKRKQQRRQDALKQIKDKQRQERNQKRSEKRTKLKEDLGLGDNYGVESSSDEEDEDAATRPQSVTVYEGEGGLTTTVTTMTLESSDDEAQPASSGEEDGEEEEKGNPRLGRARSGPGSSRLKANASGDQGSERGGPGRQKQSKQQRPGGGKKTNLGPQGGVSKKAGGKKGDAKRGKR